MVRDAIACKPAVIAETDRSGSRWPPSTAPWPSLPGVDNARIFEPEPEEVYAWQR